MAPPSQQNALKRTPLYPCHVAAGARLVEFAGWEMPVQYTSIREEHLSVRSHAGLFDVSHMGQIETRGRQALAFLQRVLTNDVRLIPEGGAQYSLICRPDGGILDDLITYRLAEQHYLTVTNAGNHERDFDWFEQQAQSFDVDIVDCASQFAMISVQGPQACRIVTDLCDGRLPPRFHAVERTCAGTGLLVCRTGYTGEDGVELLIDPEHASQVFSALVDAGVTPVGLGARDTLRLEACFHLYGNDMDESRNPIEAGLGWCCKEETDFIGAQAAADARANGTAEKLVAFVLPEGGIARHGNPVVDGGVVTSGTFSPSLNIGIGMAYLPAERSKPQTRFEIDVRGKIRPAEVRPKPLYRKEN